MKTLTDTQVRTLFKLNDEINELKRHVRENLNAPVWYGSVYDEEFQAMPEERAQQYLMADMIWDVVSENVEDLTKLCLKRKAILDCR